MDRSHVFVEPQKTLLPTRGSVVRGTFLITLALLTGFLAGLFFADSEPKALQVSNTAREVSATTVSSSVSPFLVVVTTQPDGTVGCNQLSTKFLEGGKGEGLLVYHWAGGSLDATRCTLFRAGGLLGLGTF